MGSVDAEYVQASAMKLRSHLSVCNSRETHTHTYNDNGCYDLPGCPLTKEYCLSCQDLHMRRTLSPFIDSSLCQLAKFPALKSAV